MLSAKYKNILKKSLLTFIAVVITFVSVAGPFASAALAQGRQAVGKGQWWFPKYDEFLDKVNLAPPNEIFGERYTHAQVSWIILSVVNILAGPVAACANKQDFSACMTAALSSNQDQGAILPLALMTDQLMHTKPASSVDYIASKMERLGIVNTAYAQSASEVGIGFASSLAIVQDLWRMARDASYSLIIFMILILGFMIMFRAQLGAKTIVTVQSALPRVVIGLLLITFSYAIAGLLVDLTFVAQGILAGIIQTSGLAREGATALEFFNAQNNNLGSIINLVLALLVSFFGLVLVVVGGGLGAGAAIGAAATGGTALIGFIVAAIILVLVLLIIILISLFKVFWILLRTYVVILLLTAFSPFIFLYGIVKDGITSMWLKMMVANLSVFFSVGAMIFIANFLIFATAKPGILSGILNGFNPYSLDPVSGLDNTSGVMPGFTGLGGVDIIGALAAFAIFVSLSKFASSVRDYIMKGSGDFSPAPAGSALGPIAAAGGAVGGAAVYGAKAGVGEVVREKARPIVSNIASRLVGGNSDSHTRGDGSPS